VLIMIAVDLHWTVVLKLLKPQIGNLKEELIPSKAGSQEDTSLISLPGTCCGQHAESNGKPVHSGNGWTAAASMFALRSANGLHYKQAMLGMDLAQSDCIG
jgi:hypothetical protein